MWICIVLRDGGVSKNRLKVLLAVSPFSVIKLNNCTKESSLH